jgi:cytochrome c oxidase subunit 3
MNEIIKGFEAKPEILVRTQILDENGQKTILSREESLAKLKAEGRNIVEGANLKHNEYGTPLFADFFFFITGFHGFHVFSGVIINIIIFFNVIIGTYERRGSYEMVEKVGLYWHFVDLVWVFVFTFFYLV